MFGVNLALARARELVATELVLSVSPPEAAVVDSPPTAKAAVAARALRKLTAEERAALGLD